jgi:hypothetical protein
MSEKRKNWAAIGVMFFGLFFLSLMGGLWAQQQFSGGSAVVVTSGTIIATQSTGSNLHVDVDTALPTGSNTIGAVNIAASQTVGLSAGSAAIGSLTAGTALLGKTYPYTGCGTTQVESGSPVGFAAMPTSSTSIETATTCVLSLVVTNTGASAYTYYFTDAQSTAVSVIGSAANPITINAGERDVYTFPSGVKFNSGIKAAASNVAVSYYLLGIQ